MNGFSDVVRRRVVRDSSSGVLILMYHRIAEQAWDPFELCVSPARFEEHLQVIRRYGACLRMRDLSRYLDSGVLPERAIAVTFDDGYADNVSAAMPLLERYDIPATFFLSTGHIGLERGFWWDELESLITTASVVPPEVELRLGGERQLVRPRRDTGWRQAIQRLPGMADRTARLQRRGLYLDIWRVLQPLTSAQQREVLDQLRFCLKPSERKSRRRRAVTAAEAETLGRCKLFEIGAHTVTHPLLPAHSRDLQKYEIEQSKADCEAFSDEPVTSFTCPFGGNSAETTGLIRNAGFSSNCSTQAGSVRNSSHRYDLPRIQVGNWNGAALERRLHQIARRS
jgi:peptidoglycan/xylan/chitin deacetylase (PgdA/CDA1 family)